MNGYSPLTIQRPMGTIEQPLRRRSPGSQSVASEPRRVELLAALTLQISRGKPREALALIDGLLAGARQRNQTKFVAELSTLRSVAELELMREETARNSHTCGAANEQDLVSLILEFTRRIAPAIERVATNGSNPVLTEQVVNELYHGVIPTPEPLSDARQLLSLRELQVLQLVAMGLSNQQVGFQLCISEGTVKKHLSNLLDKLNACNRTQAVARARSIGIL